MRKRHPLLIVFSGLLIMLLMIHGCGISVGMQDDNPHTEIDDVPIPSSMRIAVPEDKKPSPRRIEFTLRYDPENSLNPITSLSSGNILLSSLLYEPLFTLGDGFMAKPVLCESWSIDETDALTHTYIIRPDIAMNDGSVLTADDVVYTLKQAMQKGRYVNRFDNVSGIASDGELTITVVLKSPNNRFNRLLDIPIIQAGSIDSSIPPGTGPYVLAGYVTKRLDRFTKHRYFSELPISTIRLLECGDNEVTEFFSDGAISLLWDDPSGAAALSLNNLFESRYFDTTTLQFLGFNARKAAMRDPDVRRAIGCAVNRELITSDIMPGQSLAAPLAISPAYANYSSDWESSDVDPLVEMSALFARAGLVDTDGDPYLEYPDYSGGYKLLNIDFIVNTENAHKVEAAYKIAETLRLSGIDIVVRELPWEKFMSALETGDFDMYYGEVAIGADFDFSSLILPGGTLDYGSTGSQEYTQYIEYFLEAKTLTGEIEAAKLLCSEIKYNAPFIPILYKRYAVYTPIGMLLSASPTQSGVFTNIADWEVELTRMP